MIVRSDSARSALAYGGLFAALCAAFAASLAFGAVRLSPAEALAALFSGDSADISVVIVRLRFTRACLAAAVGASLATSGVVFQGLFRNPLADPYVIGSSGGAAFGAVCAIAFGSSAGALGFSGVGMAAFVGGLGSTLIVYLVAGTTRLRSDASSLLLAGTALGSLFSALVSIVLALKDKDLHQAWFWLLGGFSGRGLPELGASAPAMLIGLVAALLSARSLDMLSGGDEEAMSLGLRPVRTRFIVGGFAALSVSAAVALSGAIGFVGLVSPHLSRRLVGPSHLRLIPAAAMTGAVLLIIADTVARSAFVPVEMPVGAMTALIGAPFFIYKIAKRGLDDTR
ncbi:MAG: iron ABC transporter permease [Spirochaetia bacterium]|jgi:iron complex transport system permease protein|nr:iron ABC transporter permease [Spirochaetia bacterium]